ncbi:membrane-bound lytic murein transglycosylase MltF [Cellvibrio japonicus]|uniref:Membrane-bound lytic murein transglycosylase F n=1 Tax=Cellvibrio japonicus (strain Ueda107) TaxID=498211 RepID=MLTF_CELJU|nr:membrane-bound lytic murein transglycosylase MltF [Cellvibrio japonicus]B3PLH7.1 RecName: Full=Membrane-bound lytic murein transglycosylase F; AltName: Full=Murein lyase F; Flags: Precursor [Cellvibrio japonicus Ueda107]ACE85968.1 lytic murein transglycosylase, putative, lmt23C [Cellvibrio japonicus Ueda107]QEI12966.1 membrane-bound lytic murein transglycosylase MltF [Cellvibrio japonicus]QEI16540.1 membrane-bound lytic murein transglycosylase MltF [Cellvibrio japonicus]QEI20118.1 membrane-
MEIRKLSLSTIRSIITSLSVLVLVISASATLVRSTPPNVLEQVLASGELRVISTNGATTFYEGSDGLTGFEYSLLKGFADSLGVNLAIENQADTRELLHAVEQRQYHMGSAELTALESQDYHLSFAKPYMQITQQLVYNHRLGTPTSIKDLKGKEVLILADSAHSKRVARLQKKFPNLTWRPIENGQMIDLLEMVHKGEADYAVIDSNAYELHRYSYPRAKLAFDISNPQPLAWAFPHSKDTSLFDAAQRYMAQIKRDGSLAQVTKHFFERHIDEVTTGEAMVFAYRLQNRFPQWSDAMKSAATEFDLDWQMLAAIGYQESHWLADAESHTGVRGLMMLTKRTARAMGVNNREDPLQSIYGGAKYFRMMLDRLPERIQGDDRLNLALAAYNQGAGHLEDARVLTQRMGGNPDKWEDVRKYMPLLSKSQYYSRAKHGYMRGWEPVQFVDNVRNYHKIIAWHEQQNELRLASYSGGALSSLHKAPTETAAQGENLSL